MEEQFNKERWNKEYEFGAHWEKEYSQSAAKLAKLYSPGSRVLDAGCGSGRNSIFFANMGFEVAGIDVSPVAIQKAKEKNNEIIFLAGRLEKLPFQKEYFDAIYCSYVLSFTEYGKSIKEFARVLKNKGLIYIACLYETYYPSNTLYDNYINLENLLTKLKGYFIIKTQNCDQYTETDQHGIHTHKRVELILEKRKR